VNEFELIARYFTRPPRSRSVALGVGDDAALVEPTPGCEVAVSTDMLVEGRHFVAGADPEALGHKTLAVNLSDLAAMGAAPRWALLAGALPDAEPAWLAAFARGFLALADANGVDLIGGDTTRGPRNLCVTIMGEVPVGQALTRGHARPGDDVWVSGLLGDAALALAALAGRTTLAADALAMCQGHLDRPQPRIALGLALRGIATAAIDVSDGLVGDLDHVLDRSHVGAHVELAAIPRSNALAVKLAGGDRALALQCLLAGGDDYELLFTAPRGAAQQIEAIAAVLPLPLARIGAIVREPGLVVLDERGTRLATLPQAYDHFAAQ